MSKSEKTSAATKHAVGPLVYIVGSGNHRTFYFCRQGYTVNDQMQKKQKISEPFIARFLTTLSMDNTS